MTAPPPDHTPDIVPDIVIVGAGAAGLVAALSLGPRPVTVIAEYPLGGLSSSAWAQGGFAAAVGPGDTTQSHAADTLKAAAGTGDADVAHLLTAEAPAHVRLLESYGVRFERNEAGEFRLSREASHECNRVLKAAAADGFGAELMRALTAAAKTSPWIHLAEGVSAQRLIVKDGRVQGVLARGPDGAALTFPARAVLLATGGSSALYATTTNPPGAVGRGLALAARAGATLSDLEFVQFHPTALDLGIDPAPLATEALRGEGATLIDETGAPVMQGIHPSGDLAPRDAVSRAVFAVLARGGRVFLDCRKIDVTPFTALRAACASKGIDPAETPVPVRPAAHYHMGGVATDVNGRASLSGLWAAGEVASTGLHGANRLASNSLMEAVIMGARAARDMSDVLGLRRTPGTVTAPPLPPQGHLPPARARIRAIMDDKVGVLRDEAGLNAAIAELQKIETESESQDATAADMALVARLIASCALERTETRGGHARTDFPDPSPAWERRSFLPPLHGT